MGLKMMEKMGQMGNSEEATMPDDLPFDIEDLDIEDDNQPMEMQVGGYVPGQYQQGYGTYTLPGTGIMQQQPSYLSGYGQQPQQTYDYGIYNVPAYQQFTPATYTPEPYTGPTFEELIPSTTGMYDEMRRYVNADGQVRMIPFVDGRPIYPIPAGFYPEAEAKQPDIPAPTDVSTGTTRVTDEGDEEPFAPGPRFDQFGREEDPRITQVTKSEQFSKLAKEVDPRGTLTKIKDDFLGAIGASTTSQEYQKALNELSVGVANYTSDPAEQSKLIAEIRGNIGQPTRTELGMDLAPVTTDDVLAKKLAEQRQAVTPDPLLATGTAPTSVGVETARVGTTLETVQDAENTVSGTARENVKFLNDVMNQLNITENQKMDYLVKAASGQGSQTFVTGPNRTDTVRVDFSTFTPEVSAAAQEMIDVIGNRGDENLKSMLSSSQESARARVKPITAEPIYREPDPTSDILPGEPGSDTAFDRARQEEEDRQTQNYKDRGYSPSAAAAAAKNKVAADNAAKQQRRDRGESEENIAKTSAVTDSKGNAVTSGSDGSIVTSGPQTEDPGPSKIVCTEMYRQTQLDDWKEAIKIWGVYEKKYLTPYHEKGYHWLFMPWVKGMRHSTVMTSVGAYLAKARTQHLKHVMTKGKAPDNIVGNVWCKIVHPLVYIAGRTKEWLKL
jgi:hypothetical protein